MARDTDPLFGAVRGRIRAKQCRNRLNQPFFGPKAPFSAKSEKKIFRASFKALYRQSPFKAPLSHSPKGPGLKKRPENFFSQKCSKVAVLGQFFVLKRLAALICPDSAAKGPKTAKMCKKAIFVKIVKTPIFRNLGCP